MPVKRAWVVVAARLRRKKQYGKLSINSTESFFPGSCLHERRIELFLIKFAVMKHSDLLLFHRSALKQKSRWDGNYR